MPSGTITFDVMREIIAQPLQNSVASASEVAAEAPTSQISHGGFVRKAKATPGLILGLWFITKRRA